MSIASLIENLCINLGRNNKPQYVSMLVAAAKGIFRPIFTMADKKQDPESKKYTAIREGLTELIAIPVYWGSGALASVLAKKLSKPSDMAKDVFENIMKDKTVTEVTEDVAKNIKKGVFKRTTTLSMLGVFLSALVVIPAICSATIKPLMKVLQRNKQNNNQNVVKPEVNNSVTTVNSKPQLNKNDLFARVGRCSMSFSGMKVGGV